MHAVVELPLFRIKFFNTLSWAWEEFDLIAFDEQQARAYVDKLVPEDYRLRRLRGSLESDTLVIVSLGMQTVPFRL